MLLAARTAPKGRGMNQLEAVCVEKKEITRIAERLTALGEEYAIPAFIRDAGNIREAEYMILIGTKIKALGLKKCGMCGFENCQAKEQHPEVPCVFNTGDLGIAIGSMVSVAIRHHVDNRIMYTVGQAVREMDIFSDDVKVIYGIPLSGTSKNPFFDRT
jgi:uncharacterized ferredoxin-like protein